MLSFDSAGRPRALVLPEANEFDYWLRLAVLLDPAAYVLHKGGSWNVTVPDGTAWYSLNMWNVRLGASGGTIWQRRVGKLWDALMLPAGTNLQDNGLNGMLYVCKPELVVNTDARYRDPRGLFFERMARLKTLPLVDINMSISAGGAVTNNVASAAFPTDFSKGMIVAAHIFDGAWTITANGPGPSDGLMNLTDEISDAHALRFAESMLLPFNRASHPYVQIHAGNVDGASGTALAANGGVLYHKLPSDW